MTNNTIAGKFNFLVLLRCCREALRNSTDKIYRFIFTIELDCDYFAVIFNMNALALHHVTEHVCRRRRHCYFIYLSNQSKWLMSYAKPMGWLKSYDSNQCAMATGKMWNMNFCCHNQSRIGLPQTM